MSKKLWPFLLGGCVLLAACGKETSLEAPPHQALTAADRDRVAVYAEVASVLKKVYAYRHAKWEAYAAIASGFYKDERVLLRDLLFPGSSPLYSYAPFLKWKPRQGEFRSTFLNEVRDGKYPRLQQLLAGTLKDYLYRTEDYPAFPQHELFSNAQGIAIYYPYSENHSWIRPDDPNINTTPWGPLVTIVYADRNSNSGPGSQPYSCSADPNELESVDNTTLCYREVAVDDTYAESGATHIVTGGAEPAETARVTEPTGQLVYIGEVRCTQQFDNLISIKNGGGSELRFVRGDGYLSQASNGQITHPANVVSVDIRRKDIKKGNWVRSYAIWDAAWEPANKEQAFGIYEEDLSTTTKLAIGVKTTVKRTDGSTTEATVGFDFTFQTQDAIIRALGWNRESFFRYNKGGLGNGCGLRNGWTVYDCNSHVQYTMPTQ